MKTRTLPTSLLLCFFLAFSTWQGRILADDALKTTRPKTYDEFADGSKQIADALAMAKKGHKNVLLQFGANCCGWWQELHKVFEADKAIAEKLKREFVIVMVDMNKDHNKDVDTKYDLQLASDCLPSSFWIAMASR